MVRSSRTADLWTMRAILEPACGDVDVVTGAVARVVAVAVHAEVRCAALREVFREFGIRRRDDLRLNDDKGVRIALRFHRRLALKPEVLEPLAQPAGHAHAEVPKGAFTVAVDRGLVR